MEQKLIMMPVKQNQVVEVVQKNNFNKKDFEFTPLDNNHFQIVYKPFPHFKFSLNGGNYRGVPGSGGHPEFSNRSQSWEHALRAMDTWLHYVRENIAVGNPWAEEAETIKSFFAPDNTHATHELLSNEEQKMFAEKIDLLLDRMQSMEIDVSKISIDMEDLKSKSSKISKKDLMLMLMGYFAGYFLTGILPAAKAGIIWELVGQVIQVVKFLAAHSH